MYLFLILAVPLFSLILFQGAFRMAYQGEARKAYLRGLIWALPLSAGSALFGLAPIGEPGSAGIILREWLATALPYCILPYLAFRLAYRKEDSQDPIALERAFLSFASACLTPAGLIHAVETWREPNANSLFLYPLSLLAFLLGGFTLVSFAKKTARAGFIFIIGGLAVLSLLLSLGPWLFLRGLWWAELALVLLAALGFGLPTLRLLGINRNGAYKNAEPPKIDSPA